MIILYRHSEWYSKNVSLWENCRNVFPDLNLTEFHKSGILSHQIFSNNELTKNILRDDNSLLCSREKEKRNGSPKANMNVWIYFIHVLYEKQDEIICKRQAADRGRVLCIRLKAGDKLSNLLES